MFADIVDFTRLAEELPPKYMVTILNEVFSRFDEWPRSTGLEKIKTIGDAYMVAGGLTCITATRRTACRIALQPTRCANWRSTCATHDARFPAPARGCRSTSASAPARWWRA